MSDRQIPKNKFGICKTLCACAVLIIPLAISIFYPVVSSAAPVSVSAGVMGSSSAYNNAQKIVRDSLGTLYMAYHKGGTPQIYVATSTNDGASWTDMGAAPIQNIPGYTQMYPAIAIDSADNLHVVWTGTDASNANGQIKYSSYNGTSWSAWVNIQPITGHNQNYPAIAVDSTDNLHVVWEGADGGQSFSQIKYSKFTGSWSAWIHIQLIAGYHQQHAAIAIDTLNNIHVVWDGTDATYTTNSQIKYSKYTGVWSAWANIQAVGGYTQQNPAIIIDSLEMPNVIWHGTDAGNAANSQIKYSKYAAGWSAWVNIQTVAGYTQAYPSLTVDNAGALHAMWMGTDGGYPTNTQIKYSKYTLGAWSGWANKTANGVNPQANPALRWSRYNMNGGYLEWAWTNSTTLTYDKDNAVQMPSNFSNPSIGPDNLLTAYDNSRKLARDSGGNLYFAYYKGTPNQIYVAKSTNDGATWTDIGGAPISTVAGYDQFFPSIAIDAADNIHVVWMGQDAGNIGNYQIKHSFYNGTSWSAWQNIHGSIAFPQWAPSLAIDGTGVPHVVWYGRDAGNANTQIKYSKYSAGAWSGWVNIQTLAAYAQDMPSIAIDSTNTPHVVWRGMDGGNAANAQIKYSKYNGASWTAWTNIQTIAGRSQLYPSIAIDSTDRLHVAWNGLDNANTVFEQIKYSFYNGAAWSAWTNIQLVSGYTQWYPTIAVDNTDMVHVIWYGTDGSNPTYTQIKYSNCTATCSNNVNWSAWTNKTSNPAANQAYPNMRWSRHTTNYGNLEWVWTNQGGTNTIFYQSDANYKLKDWFAPAFGVTDGANAAWNNSDTITVTVSDTGGSGANATTNWGYSPDAACTAGDTYGGSGTSVTVNTNHTDYVCFRNIDYAGNIGYSAAIGPLKVDASPPTFGITDGANGVWNNSDTITVTVGDTGGSGAGATTNWGFSPDTVCDASDTYGNTGLTTTVNTDHTDYICFRNTDIAGNTGYSAAIGAFKVDASPPSFTYNSPTAGGTTGWYNTDPGAFINIDLIWGSGAPITSLDYKIGAGVWNSAWTGSQSSDYTANWSIPWGSLVDGNNQISIRGYDAAGNVFIHNYSAGVSGFIFRKDTSSPSFGISDNANVGWTNSDTITVTVTDGAGSGASGTTYWGFSADAICNGGDTYGNTGLTTTVTTDHNDYVCFKNTDLAGNTGYSPPIGPLQVDGTAPTFTVTDDASGTWGLSDTLAVTVNDTGGSGAQVTTWYAFSADTTCNATDTFALNGTSVNVNTDHTDYLCFRNMDNAGNTGYSSALGPLKVDASPPSLTYNSPTIGGSTSWYSTDPGTAFDIDLVWGSGSPITSFEYKIGAAGTWNSIWSGSQSSNYTTDWGVDWSSLVDGGNMISVRGYDSAGNSVSHSYTLGVSGFMLYKDTTGPVFPITDGASGVWVGSDIITVTVNDAGGAGAGATTTWGFSTDATCNGADTYGNTGLTTTINTTHTDYVCFSNTDLAGNIGYSSAFGPLMVDPDPPVFTVVDGAHPSWTMSDTIEVSVTDGSGSGLGIITGFGYSGDNVCNGIDAYGAGSGTSTVIVAAHTDYICFRNIDQAGNMGFSPAIGPLKVTTSMFVDSGQTLGADNSISAFSGDIDGDGDFDYIEGTTASNKVWINNSAGIFADSGQSLGPYNTTSVFLADVDNDADLDIIEGVYGSGNRIWLYSKAAGTFSDSGQSLGASDTNSVFAVDVDKDGDMDIIEGTYTGQADKIWLNDGAGVFTDSGQALGTNSTYSVFAADVDKDGDPDIVEGIYGSANQIWLNDGAGVFTDSGQTMGGFNTTSVIPADVDGDGDIDIIEGNDSQSNKIWLNDGSGFFSDSGQNLGASMTYSVFGGDLDGDGDIDILEANDTGEADKIWINATNATSTQPLPPTLTDEPTNYIGAASGTITLLWSGGSDAETTDADLLTFDLRIGTTSGGCEVYCGYFPATGTTPFKSAWIGNVGATHTYSINLATGTYYWAVRTVDATCNRSAWTAEDTFIVMSADTSPPTFAGLTSAADRWLGTSVLLTWAPATDPSTPIIYNIFVATFSGGQNFGGMAYASTTNSTGTIVYGLATDQIYYFVVRAEDSQGNVATNTVEFATTPTCKGLLTISNNVNSVTDAIGGSSPIPGSKVEYVATYSNSPNYCFASAPQIIGYVPANSAYLPGSIKLNGVAKSDAIDGDSCHLLAGPARVLCAPADIMPGATGSLIFTVTIN